jgi:hypothetical protein
MRLLVFWGSKEEADFQTPKEVKWEDGSPVTLEDYYRNQLATQSAHPTEKGLATVLCPDVVAITRFDVAKGHWVLYTDRGSMDLDETDPNASDADLDAQLATYPVIYQSTFDRSHLRLVVAGSK